MGVRVPAAAHEGGAARGGEGVGGVVELVLQGLVTGGRTEFQTMIRQGKSVLQTSIQVDGQ